MDIYSPSVEQVNMLINQPGMRPLGVPRWVTRLDAAPVLSDSRNMALAYAGGCALFEHLGRGSYEGHIFALPTYRGRQAVEFGRAAINWLFSRVNADSLLAMVPNQLPQARIYCKRLGMESRGRDLFQEHFQAEARQWVA